jgi:copper homeostasis protein
MAQLEIACFSVQSAVIAQQAGAHRIELCADRMAGGTTPTIAVFSQVIAQVDLPIYVMIRPRGGNFVYTPAEFEQMKQSLLQFKHAGAHGFVFGCLIENGTVHPTQNKELLQLAHPLPCTFHRAFDEIQEKEQALQELINLGFHNVLTAGHQGDALAGIPFLKNMYDQAHGAINILAGGGVRSANATKILINTGLSWLHSSAITCGEEADATEIKSLVMAGQLA